MTERTRRKRRRPPTGPEHVCVHCAQEFDPRDEADGVFCCDRARWEYTAAETYLESRDDHH